MNLEHLKDYMVLCNKHNTTPTWNGLNMFKEITKGTHQDR